MELYCNLKDKFIENIDRENKQQTIKNLLESDNSLFLMFLPDDMMEEFLFLDDDYIKIFIKLFEFVENQHYLNIFIGNVLNLLCDKFTNSSNVQKFNLNIILNNNIKYIKKENCMKYLEVYTKINIALIAEHHNYNEIYNEYLNETNIKDQLTLILKKFEKDKLITHICAFFDILNKNLFEHVIKYVSNFITEKYNLYGVLTSKHLTLENVISLAKKQSPTISKKFFENKIAANMILNFNNIFIDWLILENKLNFCDDNLTSLQALASDANNSNRILKMIENMSDEMFDKNIEKIKAIITNLLPNLDIMLLANFSQNLIERNEIFEIYKQHVPPLIKIYKMQNYSVDDLCDAISNTKLNEKNHKLTFQFINVTSLIEKYLDEPVLISCLKNVTIPFRKIIVNGVVEKYKNLTKQTLLKFNNIYPIIIKKIYSEYLTVKFSKLIVAKIDMKSISLSNEEILNMCLIKEDYECGICYLNQIEIICKTCGHGMCNSCESEIKKDNCSFCRETYNCVKIRS